MKSVPNWISYLHANFWIFSPFLAILFNFLKSKTNLDFTIFLFNLRSEFEEVTMEKVVPFFQTFTTIFYFKMFDTGKVLFG
jgi:hypothetical protein